LSEHPLAKAIISAYGDSSLPTSVDFERIPGKGVKAKIEGEEIFVGSASLLSDRNISIPTISAENESLTPAYVIKNGKLAGTIFMGDEIRPGSKEAIDEIKSMGIKVMMITGDSESVASVVAKNLGIDGYFAHVLPAEKDDKVEELMNEGLKVAMVGDGVNDAPALARADIGVAIGAGTNIAVEAADIILVKDDPRDVARMIRLSRLTYGKMVQNLFWATGYNVVAIPLAAGVLVSKGIVLSPAVGAALMSLSTIIVAINALMMKRKKI
jgi:Cu2+-exporting ATPase